MIQDDDHGIFFSAEATLALIPLFIILFAIANINTDYTHSYKEMVLYHQAQDTLDIMSSSATDDVLDQVSLAVSSNQLGRAQKIADSYLKKTIGNRKYMLVETNYLHGKVICSNAQFKDLKNVVVTVKYQRNCIYKLYIAE